jgi:hypothetical protein
VESRGRIEFQFPDGQLITGDYETFTRVQLQRGSRLDHDGTSWVMRDREDRAGVTVYLFTPADADDDINTERPRARSHRGGFS